jgi:hypothetical protein
MVTCEGVHADIQASLVGVKAQRQRNLLTQLGLYTTYIRMGGSGSHTHSNISVMRTHIHNDSDHAKQPAYAY